MLSYSSAWIIWFIVNLLCAACATALLCQIILASRERKLTVSTWGLIPLLLITSLPFIQSLGHGQNTCISLLLLTATVALWRSEKLITAGTVAGLLFYKPQLAVLIATALVLREGLKPLVGLALTGVALLLATLLTLPGTLTDFLHKLPTNITYMQVEHRYLWERHVTLKTFWRLLLQGYQIGDLTPLTKALYLTTTIALAAALLFAIWKTRANKDSQTRDRVIAATLVAMPLLMPFYFDYDLLLLSVAAVLLASQTRIDRPLLIGWIALYAWLFVNHAVAAATHVNGTVLLLAALATMLIARAWRQPVTIDQIVPHERELRRAA